VSGPSHKGYHNGRESRFRTELGSSSLGVKDHSKSGGPTLYTTAPSISGRKPDRRRRRVSDHRGRYRNADESPPVASTRTAFFSTENPQGKKLELLRTPGEEESAGRAKTPSPSGVKKKAFFLFGKEPLVKTFPQGGWLRPDSKPFLVSGRRCEVKVPRARRKPLRRGTARRPKSDLKKPFLLKQIKEALQTNQPQIFFDLQ